MPAVFLGRLLPFGMAGFPSPSQIPRDLWMRNKLSSVLRLFTVSSCCSRQLSQWLGTLRACIRASIFALSSCQDQHSRSMEKYPSTGYKGMVRGSRAVSRQQKYVVEKSWHLFSTWHFSPFFPSRLTRIMLRILGSLLILAGIISTGCR